MEKSHSVDNLFGFVVLLTSLGVPAVLRQRVLLFGVVGALVLRGVFIAIGAVALQPFGVTFLVLGLILPATAAPVLRDARRGHRAVDPPGAVQLIRRLVPVTDAYRGTRLTAVVGGRRSLTPLALAIGAVLATDLVLTANAFALLGLRALYFLLADLLGRLIHLGYRLATILALIGVELVAHWAHSIWPAVPQVPDLVSLGAIVAVLVTVTATSLVATRGRGSLRSAAR